MIIEVSDTLAAFKSWQNSIKEKLAPKVIAITGSNGKTTTKRYGRCGGGTAVQNLQNTRKSQ